MKHNWFYEVFDSSVDLAVVVAYDSVYLTHLKKRGGKNEITKYVDRDGLMIMWNNKKWDGSKWCFVARDAAPDVNAIKCIGRIVCLMSERLHPTAIWSDALAKLSENANAGWRCWLCVRCQRCCTRPRCSQMHWRNLAMPKVLHPTLRRLDALAKLSDGRRCCKRFRTVACTGKLSDLTLAGNAGWASSIIADWPASWSTDNWPSWSVD